MPDMNKIIFDESFPNFISGIVIRQTIVPLFRADNKKKLIFTPIYKKIIKIFL